MSDDPLDETIRAGRKAVEAQELIADWRYLNSMEPPDLILIEAANMIHPAELDSLKRVGFGTCHIQQPDGAMKLVSVSIVAPQVDPWEGKGPEIHIEYKPMSDEELRKIGNDIMANLKARGMSHMDTPRYVSHPSFEPERWNVNGKIYTERQQMTDEMSKIKLGLYAPSLLRRLWARWVWFWEHGE
jgi:hypothetical protein